MEETGTTTKNISNILGIDHSIRHIYIEETDSPWNEKALIKRKKDHLDVKVTIWEDSTFLYGRIYRLFLYIYDVLNPHFRYNPHIAPEESKEPRLKDRHNQIWSIYVDSRLEKKGIENFFNRAVRKNIFIDAENEFTWEEASLIFHKLWEQDSYTYSEITDYTYNLAALVVGNQAKKDSFELDINRRIQNVYVKDHIDKIQSSAFKEVVNELLSYTAYYCKDIYIESSHYGIIITYQKVFFAEMIPTNENTLFFTIHNPASHSYETEIITEHSNIETVQKHIKETYNKISMHTV
ncbi:MAG: hypothetical protein NTX75_09905 [Proteobacteria bacterium]|nr:hypothetical protein [Pseudomonadota bacterium]